MNNTRRAEESSAGLSTPAGGPREVGREIAPTSRERLQGAKKQIRLWGNPSGDRSTPIETIDRR